jgi:predicted house-cleaning noncanonical NTP pyrophosphatase (MazG superfamily)
MKVYNKLVRDKIPKIILESGKKCEYIVLSEEEYIVNLKSKLLEEAQELICAKTKKDIIEELVDLTEILNAIMDYENVSSGTLETVRKEKSKQKGNFQKRYFLKNVIE